MQKDKNLLQHFTTCITSKYFQFSGRASRAEFWGFILFSILANQVFAFASNVFSDIVYYPKLTYGINTLLDTYLLLPSISVGVRRFHDTSRSGWVPVTFGILTDITTLQSITYLFFGSTLFFDNFGSFLPSGGVWFVFFAIITVVLGIYYIIIAAQAGAEGLNMYGTNPLSPEIGNEIEDIGLE